MPRLTAYLFRLFSGNALAFAAVASVLIWLIQCLRIFDVVTVKGQGLTTLLGQAVLTMPPFLMVFLYMVMGIGLGRSLRDLQASQELHTIHSSRRLGALLRAVALYAAAGMAVVLVLSNFIDPLATRRLNDWSASIAADLVSRALSPHKFSQVTPGVVVVISGRRGNGEITEFFADDRRDPETRRTYIAKSAVIQADSDGYIIHMRDGSLQYLGADDDFSEITFAAYDVALERLTDPIEDRDAVAEKDTIQLIVEQSALPQWNPNVAAKVAGRMSEGVRILAMCLFVAALTAFPTGSRRRFRLPIEVTVLIVAFAERGISTYAPVPPLVLPFAGALAVMALGALIMAVKLRLFRPNFGLYGAIRNARRSAA